MKLFLASYFAGVAKLLPKFLGLPLAGKKVCYIPTASVVEEVDFFVGTSKKWLAKLGLEIDELEISTAAANDIAEKIANADIIFIEGGNTFFLLQELKRSGADALIKQRINAGAPYIGTSAGSMILARDIEYAKHMDATAKAPALNGDFTALALVDFYVVPHFTNFPFKKAGQKIVEQYGVEFDLKAISNHQAVTVDGDAIAVVEVERKPKKTAPK
jgi:Peptidase E